MEQPEGTCNTVYALKLIVFNLKTGCLNAFAYKVQLSFKLCIILLETTCIVDVLERRPKQGQNPLI